MFSPSDYRAYYKGSAQTWERQSLTRARPVAGNVETARFYMRAAHDAIYTTPLTDQAREEIVNMKRRIEAERLKAEERWSDVKLGHGWTASSAIHSSCATRSEP